MRDQRIVAVCAGLRRGSASSGKIDAVFQLRPLADVLGGIGMIGESIRAAVGERQRVFDGIFDFAPGVGGPARDSIRSMICSAGRRLWPLLIER